MTWRQQAYFRVISGADRRLRAIAARAVLRSLSWGYAVGAGMHHLLYDWKLRETHHVPIPVISVGNLTAGGTGKTPFVAFLVQWFLAQGIRPGILSRGYASAAETGNDEFQVLQLACPDTPHIQDPDRIRGAQRLIHEQHVQVIILDDGFQHRRLARDLDLVLVDATCPWGHGGLLPRGLLREPVRALRRADVAVLTRVELVDADVVQGIEKRVRHYLPPPLVHCSYPPRGLRNSAGQAQPLDTVAGRRVVGFCGIGNPAGFRRTVEQLGAVVVDWVEYPDHHHYDAQDLARLGQTAGERSADFLLTTVKDLVKIPEPQIASLPVWAIDIGARFPHGLDELEPFLIRIAAQVPDR